MLVVALLAERMGGGGEHGAGHGHGVPAEYPGWPKEVWSPTGGWYCNPRNWRRNTALTMFGIFLICIPLAIKSAELEQRPVPPVFPIPSQLWCKNFGKPLEEKAADLDA